MKKSIFILTTSVFTLLVIASSEAQVKTDTATKAKTKKQVDSTITQNPQDSVGTTAKAKIVGGAQMLPANDIIENTSKSKDHTVLVEAIKSSGLVDTLKAEGPFTVFAPTNDAFAKLPAGTLDTLKQPENKEKLADVVEYHVVPGKLTSRDLALAVARAKGTATLTTVEGEDLTVSINAEKNLQITDAQGNVALVTMFDVEQANGVVHVINNVLIPNAGH